MNGFSILCVCGAGSYLQYDARAEEPKSNHGECEAEQGSLVGVMLHFLVS